MFVRDIMSTRVLSLKPSDTVNKFIALMENKHVHEVPIIEDKKFLGMVRFKALVSRGVSNPVKQKLRSLMDFPPPTLEPDMSIEEAAELISKTGLRALPVLEKKKVVGIVSIFDILELASKSKEFRQTPAESVMSIALVTSQNSDIGTVRVMMREKAISRIPLVDDEGKIVGIVAAFDLMKAVKQSKEKMTWYNMAAEMERVSAMPISNLMNRKPPTVRRRDSLNDVVNKMLKHKCSGITVADKGVPVGIVTVKDLLEVFVAGGVQKGVYYHAIGLEHENDFVVSTVHRMIGDSIEKIASIYPIQFMFIHFKKYKYRGLKAKWSVRIRLMTDKGLFMSKAWGWDPRDAVGDALYRLERNLIKRKKELKDKIRYNIRKLKESLGPQTK
ncbi:MAG: CBS domain-containing protein [Candidatus Aenigmatarchaeota archaeon]